MAAGLSSAWVVDRYTKSRLFVGEYDARTRTLHLGWQLSLKDGWKTYWRTPGDAGLPPRWAWKKAENIKNIAVNWPLPELLHIFDMDTYVYHDEVILPIEVTVKDAAKPVSVALDLDYMICSDICVPKLGKYHIQVSDLDDVKIPLFQKAQLDRYRARVPGKISGDGIGAYMVGQDILAIDLPAEFDGVNKIIIEGPDGDLLGQALPESAPENADKKHFRLAYGGDGLTGRGITLTLLRGEGGASEVSVRVGKNR